MSFSIEAKKLNVGFAGKKILEDVNLSVRGGSFAALIGANGAGKSTLLKSFCGLARYSGTVKIAGKNLQEINKSFIGYVPQNNVSDKNSPLSVYQAVSVGRFAKNGIFKKFKDTDDKIVRNAMRISQIEHIAGSPLGEISGGEAQKVSIARVLAQQPEIILLDEPQAGLDPGSQKIFLNFIERLYADFRFTCFMVTHDIDMIPRCCEKVFMLKNGRLVLETDNANISEKAAKYDIYT